MTLKPALSALLAGGAIVSAALPAMRAEAASGSLIPDIEIGHQWGRRTLNLPGPEITRNRLYVIARNDTQLYSSDRTGTTVTLNLGGRAWTDVNGNDVDVRAAAIDLSAGSFRLATGFQEIAWGETFGFFPADIVNPRDYRDPLFTDPSWVREPVFAANAQLFLGSLTLQGVFVPVPRNNRLPEVGSAYDPSSSLSAALGGLPVRVADLPDFKLEDAGRDSEFGGKASYLFDFGLDAGLIYYRHWNRNIVYELRQTTTAATLVPSSVQVDTVGFTASQAVDAFVFRADALANFGEPQQLPTFAPPPLQTHYQVIFGSDVNLPNDWTLGGQFHSDNTDLDILQWLSGKVSKKFFEGKLEGEFFAFGGLNNEDFWFQPKITWNITTSLMLSLRSDHIRGSRYITDGALPALRQQDRVMTWVSYRF